MSARGRRERGAKEGDKDGLSEEDLKMRSLMDFFIKRDVKQLVKHKQCVSSEVTNVPAEFLRECVSKFEPACVYETGGNVIVALKKPNLFEKANVEQPTTSAAATKKRPATPGREGHPRRTKDRDEEMIIIRDIRRDLFGSSK